MSKAWDLKITDGGAERMKKDPKFRGWLKSDQEEINKQEELH